MRTFPSWIQTIARQVKDCVTNPTIMGRFRRMVRQVGASLYREQEQALEAQRVRRRIYGRIAPVFTDCQPLEPKPTWTELRTMTLMEKYAALAAIHDVIFAEHDQINPWVGERETAREPRRRRRSVFKKFMYWKTGTLVADLTTADQPRIKAALSNVQADLTGCGLLTTGGSHEPKKTGTKRGRKTKLDKAAQVVNRLIDNGDLDRGRKWKELRNRYEAELPKSMTPNALRARVNRELERREREGAHA